MNFFLKSGMYVGLVFSDECIGFYSKGLHYQASILSRFIHNLYAHHIRRGGLLPRSLGVT